ncbi:DUF5522 domain-containing protein [Granulicella paludicola]|jgi:hypothetical protein|uniref:DUF5522 domain-containing protein n=1 Tax=Granulicella paludicola TaxID=474951 RepID=UPI0021E0F766|nr:DUF5522 domain-containing protein [Granulicella paludicola]
MSQEIKPDGPKPAPGEAPQVAVELQPGDFYMEGPYMVFTAAYHLRRGYCCNSDCRHCPYK